MPQAASPPHRAVSFDSQETVTDALDLSSDLELGSSLRPRCSRTGSNDTTMRSGRHRRTSSIHSLLHPPRPSWVQFLRPLLPSFLADAIFPDHHHRPTYRIRATSYLDGLRGIAAIIVFFCHYTEINFPQLVPSYGLGRPPVPGASEENAAISPTSIQEPIPSSWLQLPFIRVIYSGRPMVHIFFVISGFALSYKPVTALHARDLESCYAALGSSAFRRPFRLFGPCVASTFMILCLRQMGFLAPAKKTLAAELWKWKGALLHQITWPWGWEKDLRPAYDVHLWTIPIEFAHSMLLFVVLLMLSRVRLAVRIAGVLGLMGYCLACGKWAGFEFLAGLFLAEVHVLRTARARVKEWEGGVERYRARDEDETNWGLKCFQVGLIVLWLFIAGWPNFGPEETPGIRYILAHTPYPFANLKLDPLGPQKFWFGLSAAATVWAVGDLNSLRRFFESPFAQYCGRISYAVYICHGPVQELFQPRLVGHPTIPAVGEPGVPGYQPVLPATALKGFIGEDTPTQHAVGWLLGLWLLTPLVIWAADVFWRAVDSQIVSLARRLEMLCLDDSEPCQRSHGYSVAA